MLTEFDRKKTMSSTDVMDYARTATVRLVRRETDRRGSKMRAYEAVASMVGRSPSWVRKIVQRSPDVGLDVPTWLNIRKHYEHLCERHEADAAALQAELNTLKDEINAVDPRLNHKMAASLAGLAGQTHEGTQ
jgi:hypothetical protein